jgi:hypothetical protein
MEKRMRERERDKLVKTKERKEKRNTSLIT